MIQKKKPNIKFIMVDDNNQLKPVNDRATIGSKNSLALFELCKENRLELITRRRSNDILINMCKFENIIKSN